MNSKKYILLLFGCSFLCHVNSIPQEDLTKFDCQPEGGTEGSCKTRGCLWNDKGKDPLNTPKCFYNVMDSYCYTVTSEAEKSLELASVKPKDATRGFPYPHVMEKVGVKFFHETNSRLRIKIANLEGKSYEVPVGKTFNKDTDKAANPLYEVTYTKDPFYFTVKRKNSFTKIWDTSVGALLLAKQFLQISTKLPSKYLYGLGENSRSSFKRDFSKWHSFRMFSRDAAPYPFHNTNLYGVHPFYMVMENDGKAHGVLLLNSNAMDVTLQPTPAITFRTIGGVLDFYYFLGPTPEQVVQQYTELIGRTVMPAYWSLGFQLCRYGYNSLDEVKKTVERMSKYDIPQDVQYGDIDYMERQLDFTYDNETYNGLPEYVREIKSKGIKYITILDPAISAEEKTGTYEPYDLGTKLDIWIKDHNNKTLYGKVWPDKPGIFVNTSWPWDEQTKYFRANATFPDWFHKDIKLWWNVLIKKFYKTIPFDGLWIDMNEPANFVHGSVDGCPIDGDAKELEEPPYTPLMIKDPLKYKTLCMSALHEDGENEYNYHSLYGWKQTTITREALSETVNKRGIVISRSTYPSSGRYAGHWLGDNKSAWPQMHESLIGMLDFNLFGIPYIGADICGFNEDTTRELCMRWMHLGAFYPFSRNHNGLGFKPQDPAAFDDEFAKASRDILRHRYTLLPYFYTLFFDSHMMGSSVVTPLFHMFSEDKMTWSIDKQFMLGRGLLIAPALEKGVEKIQIYLPNARWFDYFTGKEVDRSLIGGKFNVWSMALDKIGVFIHGGTIIPIQTPANNTVFSRQLPMGLIVALDKSLSASGSLFWDDGESLDSIENGKYLHAKFKATKDMASISIVKNGFDGAKTLYYSSIKIYGLDSSQLKKIKVNGKEIDESKFTIKDGVLMIKQIKLPITEEHRIEWLTETEPKSYATTFKSNKTNCVILLLIFFIFSF